MHSKTQATGRRPSWGERQRYVYGGCSYTLIRGVSQGQPYKSVADAILTQSSLQRQTLTLFFTQLIGFAQWGQTSTNTTRCRVQTVNGRTPARNYLAGVT